MPERHPQATPAAPTTPGWLTLQEASVQLGVAPSTVRRWADAGRIPITRTAGGHRRFAAAAVQELQAPAPPVSLAPTTMAEGTIQRQSSNSPWQAHFSATIDPDQMRELGQRLLGLLLQYLVWQGDNARFLDDGRQVGQQYGQAAHDAGITLSETVEAFIHFRQMFWRTALKIPAVADANDAPEVMRIAERIDHFMNEVLLSTLSAYT